MADFIVTDLQVEGEETPPAATAPGASAPPKVPAPAGAPAGQPPAFSSLWIVLIAAVLVVVLLARWRGRFRPRGLVIENPRLGFLNLLGSEGTGLLAEDRPVLSPLFASVEERDDLPPPVCDVLVLYGDLTRDGQIFATEIGLKQLLRKSRARILILASENKSEYCLTAAQNAGQSGANLVLTMARNGAELPELFARLFADMRAGTPMTEAYNKLAPRGKIFLADAGGLVFGGPAPMA